MLLTTQLANSEFTIDFLTRVPCHWIIGASLGTPGHLVGAIGLHRLRHDRDFSDRDVGLLDALLPHVSRALLVSERLSQQPCATGIAILDEKDAVIYVNAAATQILNGQSVDTIAFPIGQSPAFGNKTIYHGSLGDYDVEMTTIQDHYRILTFAQVAYSSLPSRLARQGLTPRQQEIALRVLHKKSNKAIANERHITEQTLNDPLNAAFQPLDIHHRTELAAQVLPLF